MAYEP